MTNYQLKSEADHQSERLMSFLTQTIDDKVSLSEFNGRIGEMTEQVSDIDKL
jgi:hypothetical protein